MRGVRGPTRSVLRSTDKHTQLSESKGSDVPCGFHYDCTTGGLRLLFSTEKERRIHIKEVGS